MRELRRPGIEGRRIEDFLNIARRQEPGWRCGVGEERWLLWLERCHRRVRNSFRFEQRIEEACHHSAVQLGRGACGAGHIECRAFANDVFGAHRLEPGLLVRPGGAQRKTSHIW